MVVEQLDASVDSMNDATLDKLRQARLNALSQAHHQKQSRVQSRLKFASVFAVVLSVGGIYLGVERHSEQLIAPIPSALLEGGINNDDVALAQDIEFITWLVENESNL